MEDKILTSEFGTPKRLKHIGGGIYAEEVCSVASSNITGKFREAFEAYTPGTKWIESKAAGDLVYVDGNAAAASYLVISKDPLSANSETSIELTPELHFTFPAEIVFGVSMSQRTLGQEFSIEVVDNGDPLEDVPDIAIASISQATTTLTIDTVAPHGLSIGKSFGIARCSNPLCNYTSLVVATTPSPTQITATAGPGGTIASQTIANPAGAKGSIYFRQRLGRAQNGVSQIFENASATNASLYVRSEAGDAFPSGNISGNHTITIGSSAPVQLTNAAYTYAFGATTEYRLLLQSDRIQWADSGVDATAQMTSRLVRTQVCPDPSHLYKLRVRATNNKALTVPVAQIISAAKTGTTTATVVCDRPHGLAIGDPVVIYGARDQTNFANLTAATAVASIFDANTFTIVWGGAVTATTFGGYVAEVNGGNLMSALGAIAQVAQSAVLSTLSDGTRQLVLTGNATWAGLTIGDLVSLVGIRDNATGATLNLDGAWKVANIATTALTLVLPYAASMVLPSDFGSVNCGGAVIKRTDIRISFIRVFDYERLRVEALGRPTSDQAAAFPVVVQNGITATVSATTVSGNTAQDAAAPNPIAIGGRAANANQAAMSAAGDLVHTMHTMIGAVVEKPYCIPEAEWTYSGSLTTTSDVAVQAAAGAGIKRHATSLWAINTGASAVDLIIKDGATERVRYTLPVNIPVPVTFPTGIQNTANAALNAALSAVGTVRLNMHGYTAP